MSGNSNCPNCGAPWSAGMCVCSYCGTLNPETVSILQGKPIRVSYDVGDTEYTVNFLIGRIDTSTEYGTMLYAGNSPVMRIGIPDTSLDVSGKLVPFSGAEFGLDDDREVLIVTRDKKVIAE